MALEHTGEVGSMIDRRAMVGVILACGARGAQAAPPLSSLGVDAAQFGVRPGAAEPQTVSLQRAIAATAAQRVPLVLAPGTYRTGPLSLPPGAILRGIAGATHLVLTEGPSLLTAATATDVALEGLTLEGGGRAAPDTRGLVMLARGIGARMRDCTISRAGRHGLVLEGVGGTIESCTVLDAGAAAIFATDSAGLTLRGNRILGAADNGILVWRTSAGDDGTRVVDNLIEETHARSGGSGQNGNAINIFRAGHVAVHGNRIKTAAFSAVRGNAASGLVVANNICSGLGEVALYAEFGFQGATFTGNTVEGAAVGIAVTNFNAGGRLAVVQGNLIRDLTSRRPAGADPDDLAGVGIGVEADTAVSGNVIENAPRAGLWLGFGPHLRDVAATGNVIRRAAIGIAVSVAPGAGSALIADNLISEAREGGIVGMMFKSPVGEIAADGAARPAHLSLSGNRVR